MATDSMELPISGVMLFKNNGPLRRYRSGLSDVRDRGARIAVIVIDACRNNPFPRTGTRALGLSRGLNIKEPAEGVFSIYSAGLGQQALDRLSDKDPSRNSVFTRVS
jgi:uncharacterized protein